MFGTAERPRLSIHKTNKRTYLQAIDDKQGVTIVSASDLVAKTSKTKVVGTKTERAVAVANQVATALAKKGIKAALFDRGSFRYHGRVKAVAEALRAAGVEV